MATTIDPQVIARIKELVEDGAEIRDFLVSLHPKTMLAPQDGCGCLFYAFLCDQLPTYDFAITFTRCAVRTRGTIRREEQWVDIGGETLYERLQAAMATASEGAKYRTIEGHALITAKKALKVFDALTEGKYA